MNTIDIKIPIEAPKEKPSTLSFEQLQQRIDKAIEYLEYNDENLYTYEPDYDYEENIVDNYDASSFREDLLEILKGEDK